MLTWLADVLRAANLKVEEVPGWKLRGRDWTGATKGILVHHTAGPAKGNAPSLKLVTEGRPDLAGPLSQLVLGRDGTFYVVAAGRSNHAGAGEWQGVTAGNSSFIGIEAENMGTPADPWPEVQMTALIHGCAAILKHIGADDVMVAGHREYARPAGRKIDPLFDMFDLRRHVENVMALGVSNPPAIAPVAPERAMLRKGTHGESVKELQRRLNGGFGKWKLAGLIVDGAFGPGTEKVVKQFQATFGLVQDGQVGPKTWAALGVTNSCAC